VLGCLALSGAAWLLFTVAWYQNQIIVKDINQRIRQAQQNRQAAPPAQKDLERELEKQWSPMVLKGLLVAFLGAFCLAKLLYTGSLWAVARHFKADVLASGLVIYFLAEVLAVAVAMSIVLREPVQVTAKAPFALFTGNWYSVGFASAYCGWFLVNLYQVRRVITRSLLHDPT
jgi:hypothetical protein